MPRLNELGQREAQMEHTQRVAALIADTTQRAEALFAAAVRARRLLRTVCAIVASFYSRNQRRLADVKETMERLGAPACRAVCARARASPACATALSLASDVHRGATSMLERQVHRARAAATTVVGLRLHPGLKGRATPFPSRLKATGDE